MSLNLHCARYKRLRSRSERLTFVEASFVALHIRRCARCAEVEAQLREQGAMPDMFHENQKSGGVFADEILRKLNARRENGGGSWKPVVVGAVTAALAMGTFLQILTSEPEISHPKATGAALKEAPKSKLTLFESENREKPIKKSG